MIAVLYRTEASPHSHEHQRVVLLPRKVTVDQLKQQARKDNDFPADSKCKDLLTLYYPKDEGLTAASLSHDEHAHGRGKRHHGPR